jgi:hypothetical protein
MPLCPNCGEKVEANVKFCTNCGESLKTDKIKSSSNKNFGVPLDYSEVREVIPVGEDIIHSSLFSVFTHGLAGPFHEMSQRFNSHVLFTTNGIAFQEPKHGVMKSVYKPWYDVDGIRIGLMMIKEGTKMYAFTMIPDTNYETSNDFNMRTSRFFFEFLPHVINEKKMKRHKGGLKKLEKTYNKFKKMLGEQECEFFRTNEDNEEYRKHLPLLNKAIEETTPKWAKFLVDHL